MPWAFFFFIFKKNQNFKNICPFSNISKLPPVALWGATGPKCNFFLQICNEVHGRKKMKGPPLGRPVAPAHRRDRGVCPPCGRHGGPVAPLPSGDRVMPPYISSRPTFPPHLSPKIPQKIQKKREGWGEKKRWCSAELRTCDLPVTSVWIYWYCITI